jgi:hypothetical protein
MKVVLLGAIATSIIVVLSIISIIPVFLKDSASSDSNPIPVQTTMPTTVMATFSITGPADSEWCANLVRVIEEHDIKATIFVTGVFAQSDSHCISQLAINPDIDIGSQTYSYADITSVSDYLVALEEVREGKAAVDRAGNLDSRLFKAPYGQTDENIYSYLSGSGILADFSYDDHYNVYHEGKFIRSDDVIVVRYSVIPPATASAIDLQVEISSQLASKTDPSSEKIIIIEFGSDTPIDTISDEMSKIKSKDFLDNYEVHVVNASELLNLDLTVRKGSSETPL